MKKYVLFEEIWSENFYLKFESTHDSSMSNISVSSLSIIESLSYGSPAMILKFVDGYGDLINHTYISPIAEYDFFIGKNQFDNDKSSFKLSYAEYVNGSPGLPENIGTGITFLGNYWDALLKDTYSRSWTNVRYSDVVEEIVKKAGIKNFEIEETDGFFNIIQPDWNNFQLIRWIADRAKSVNGHVSYRFGFLSDGSFFFKSLDTLNRQKAKKILQLSHPNKDSDLFFSGFEIRQDYANVLPSGGFGVEATYFDYETKQFITKKRKFSESNQRQLADWSFIAREHETSDYRFFGGRDTNTPHVADTRISDISNSLITMTIHTQGDIKLHVGDTVHLIMNSSQYSKTLYNEKYSGNWLITKIIHTLNFQDKVFESYIDLQRCGFNGNKLKGFVKSKKGKSFS